MTPKDLENPELRKKKLKLIEEWNNRRLVKHCKEI